MNHSTHFVEFSEALNPELYDNLGSTWQDYLDNKWVLLSSEQVAFREEHPTASVKEVYDMEITPAPVRTLAQAKQEKLWAIEDYDRSDAVNGFSIVMPSGEAEGTETTAWIEPEKRSNYRGSLEDCVLLGVTDIEVPIAGMLIPMTVADARIKLAQIQLYAVKCAVVTEQHKAAVNALETVEAVDAYDYMQGYPPRLTFELENE